MTSGCSEMGPEHAFEEGLVEVTPNFIRMRKRVLDSNERRKFEKRAEA